MAQFTQYAKGSIAIGNDVQMEITEITVKWENGAKAVHTIEKGLSGPSKGSSFMTLSFKAAVPVVGFEYDALKNILNVDDVDFKLYVGDLSLSTTGFFTSHDFSHAVDTESKASYEVTAQYALWDSSI